VSLSLSGSRCVRRWPLFFAIMGGRTLFYFLARTKSGRPFATIVEWEACMHRIPALELIYDKSRRDNEICLFLLTEKSFDVTISETWIYV
jgi:hypothetical protein